MKYNFTFDIPYTLGAYDHVTLSNHLEREVKIWLGEDKIDCNLSREDW